MSKKKSDGAGGGSFSKYGERIALGCALVVAIAFSLWGMAAGGGSDIDPQKMKQNAADLQAALARNALSEQEKQQRAEERESIAKDAKSTQLTLPHNAMTTHYPWFQVLPGERIYRRNPDAESPTKLVAAPIELVFPKWERRGDEILALEAQKAFLKQVEFKPPDPKTDPERYKKWLQQEEYKKRLERQRQMMGGETGSNPPSKPPNMGGKPPNTQGGTFVAPPIAPNEGGPSEFGNNLEGTKWQLVWVHKKDSKDKPLAEQIMPSRAVLVVGSFPYEKQMERIREALSLADRSLVPTLFQRLEVEKRFIIPADTIRGTPELLFLGFDANNQPMVKELAKAGPDEGWMTVNVVGVVSHTRDAVAFESEADQEWQALRAVNSRLVALLPKLARGQYPLDQLYKQLPDLVAAKKIVDEQFKGEVQPPPEDPRIRDKGFDGFGEDPTQPTTNMGNTGGEMTPPLIPPPPPINPMNSGPATPVLKPPTVRPPPTPTNPYEKPPIEGGPYPTAITNWPKASIIRFLDVDPNMRGGTAWQYRIRVVLKNPNHKKTDTSIPRDALVSEIVGGWSPPSNIVAFQPDTYVYAREKASDERKDKPTPAERAQQAETVGLQIHRWLGIVKRQSGSSRVEERIGNWAVANILARRGEVVGQSAEVPLVVWSPNTPNEKGSFGRDTVVEKARTDAFSLGRFDQPSILVDFESRDTVNLNRPNLNVRLPADQVPTEILIMHPDGRLSARTVRKDDADTERKDRNDRWFERINAERKQREERAKEVTKPNTGTFTKP